MKQIRSVLVVEDDYADRVYCERSLKKSGCFEHILFASDAEEALNMFRKHREEGKQGPTHFPPSVILLDVNMPGMNGFEFLAEYKGICESNQDEQSAVVMLSGSDDHRDRRRASEFPMVRKYLIKPLRVDAAHEIAEEFGLCA